MVSKHIELLGSKYKLIIRRTEFQIFSFDREFCASSVPRIFKGTPFTLLPKWLSKLAGSMY